MRLFDPQYFTSLSLRQATALDDSVDLKREFRFDPFQFRMWETEIGKEIAATFSTTALSFFVMSAPDSLAMSPCNRQALLDQAVVSSCGRSPERSAKDLGRTPNSICNRLQCLSCSRIRCPSQISFPFLSCQATATTPTEIYQGKVGPESGCRA